MKNNWVRIIKSKLKKSFKYHKNLFSCKNIRKSKEKFSWNCISISNVCLGKIRTITLKIQSILKSVSQKSKLLMRRSSSWTTSMKISIHSDISTINNSSSCSITSTTLMNSSRIGTKFNQMIKTQKVQRNFLCVFFYSFSLDFYEIHERFDLKKFLRFNWDHLLSLSFFCCDWLNDRDWRALV